LTVLLGLVVFVGGASASQDAVEPVLSLPEYIAELEAIAAAIGSQDEGPSSQLPILINDVPRTWRVETPQRIFDIPTAWLQQDLRAWMTRRDAAAHSRLSIRLRTLRSEAASFERPADDLSRQRDLVTSILNSHEFRNVHGPTWFDRLRQRILEMIRGLLLAVFESSAFPTISNLLVYGLIAVAVVVLALWAARFIRRAATVEAFRSGQLPTPLMAWPQWLADAQSAAARGQWREAVHCSYWCAVSFLEAKGAWRPDRTRTPREYVSLLSSSSEDRSTLAALTRRFECVWYGTESADAQTFAETIAHLKKMGCPG
jgi:hypothetical protein